MVILTVGLLSFSQMLDKNEFIPVVVAAIE